MTFLIAFTVLSTVCQYAYNASLGFFMTLSIPVGGTQFAVHMAATNLTYSRTAKAGGWLANTVGVAQIFALAMAIQIATVALIPLCNPATPEARFRGGGAVPPSPAA